MDMLDDGLIDEFWDLVLDKSVLIDNLSFTDSHSQEDLIEQPIPDSNLALHDEQHLEHFLELVLNDVISDIIVSWFQALKQLLEVNTNLKLRIVNKLEASLCSHSENVFKHIEEVFE